MSSEEKTYQFMGFEPSDLLKTYVHEKLEILYDESPYGSTMEVVFDQLGSQYVGKVQIQSAEGLFKASAKAEKLQMLVQSLVLQIREQLRDWRSHRFEEDTADIPLKKVA